MKRPLYYLLCAIACMSMVSSAMPMPAITEAIIIDGHRMDILIDVKISWPLSHIGGSKITMEERGL